MLRFSNRYLFAHPSAYERDETALWLAGSRGATINTGQPTNASDLLVRCLVEEGINKVLGVPGDENADFMMALEKCERIRVILTRHE